MPKAKKKVAPGPKIAKIMRWRKKPLKKRARIGVRYWRMRAKVILREKRVEKAEFFDRLFERAFLNLEKDPAAVRMFCDRAIPRIRKKIDALELQIIKSFREAAKIKPAPTEKPESKWTKAEKANHEKLIKLIRGENLLENKKRGLEAEIQWLDELRKSAH